jgi:hypothetical protein
MRQKAACPLVGYASETEHIRAGLRPLLVSLVEQSIQAGSIEAALPIINEAARLVSEGFVESLHTASVESFRDGLRRAPSIPQRVSDGVTNDGESDKEGSHAGIIRVGAGVVKGSRGGGK